MKYRELFLGIFIIFSLLFVFFNQTILHGRIPFPGDLLTAEYQPWKSESYLGYVPGSIPNKAQYPDTIRQLYPWRTLATAIWRSGQIPFWNPYNFSGTPLLSNFQSAVFYPPSLLSLFLPQVWTWTILIMLQPLLTLLFTYLYCRKLKLSILASWFGAITYAFCAFNIVWLEYNTIGHVVSWLPLILLSIENLREKFNIKRTLVLIFSTAFSLLAGHPQIFFFLFAYSLFYAWFKKTDNKFFLKTLFVMLLGLGLTGIQLIPGLELVLQAARSPHPIDIYLQKILIQPWQIIMMIVPDFFGNPATRNYWPLDTYIGKVTSVGLVGLVFALISIRSGIHGRSVKFFTAAAIFILIIITANPLTAVFYRFQLPFISSSSPTLATFLLSYCLSMLAAFGFDYAEKQKPKVKTLMTILVPMSVIFILLWASLLLLPKLIHSDWVNNLHTGRKSLTYESLILISTGVLFLAFIKTKYKSAILILFLIIQVFELFIGFRKFNPFVPEKLVFPAASVFSFLSGKSSIDRFWGHGAASIEANFATPYSLFSPGGYDPLYPKRYGELIQSSSDGKIHTVFTDQTRSDAVISPGSGDTDLSANLSRLRILDLLGVKYVLDRSENGSTEKGFSPDRFRQIWKRDGWIVYENLSAAPRFFLSNDYGVFPDNHDFEKKLFDKSFNPGRTVLLEKNLPTQLTGNTKEDVVKLIKYQPNEVSFQTTSDGARLLFLSDTDYPGWQALIDDRPAGILRADYAFRAVIVPQGNHTVRFIFRPVSFTIGLIVSLASISVLILLLLVKKSRHYV